MQINDLRIEKFNKISKLTSLSKPELLSNLCIIDSFDYAKNVQSFYATDRKGNFYQIYIGHTPHQNQINQIVYLKDCPKIILLQDQSQSLIIEQNIQERLSDLLIKNQQQKNVPYLDQSDARRIVMNVSESLVNYLQCKIKVYDCISPNNVVLNGGVWQLSAVGLVLGVDQNSLQYSLNQLKNNENRMTFALGCLLFKLIFGFTPVNSNTKKFTDFKTSNFLKRLQFEQNQKLLKVYYYTQRLSQISPNCLKLLQKSLSSKMTISEWLLDEYFRSQLSYQHLKANSLKNKELSMINSVDSSNYSILMPAIDYKKKHKFQRLNQKRILSPEQLSLLQSLNQLKKHSIFSNIAVSQLIQKRFLNKKVQNTQQEISLVSSDYFYNQTFDPKEDKPCLSLFNFIENERRKNPEQFKDPQYQNKLKMYAYPYAVAFQLLKVIQQQPLQVKRKIRKLIQMLLQISTINYPRTVPPLHNTQQTIESFDQIKQIYRQNINDLYQQFLNQAMKKYNYHSQNQSMKERQKRKDEGLQNYRLCLKLLQASLIVRKGGADLNLTRIYTGERKQIQNDLNQLLARYFPQKPVIN